MKMNRLKLGLVVAVAALLPAMAVNAQGPRGKGGGHGPGAGRGPMPAEYRDIIHELFSNHEKVKRQVQLTENGYTAETTSDDPEMTKLLRSHVRQMGGRLGGGGMVRRWDPAFEEFARHYAQLEHKLTDIEGGIRVEVTAKTADAARVAKNHAKIISGFAKDGEKRMHAEHAPALADSGGEVAKAVGERTECTECARPGEGKKARAQCEHCAKEPAAQGDGAACKKCKEAETSENAPSKEAACEKCKIKQ